MGDNLGPLSNVAAALLAFAIFFNILADTG